MNRENALLLETEHFSDLGGWMLDAQFVEEMGSPFLLAHGLGIPVSPARHSFASPAGSRFRLWVRTRDWTGQQGPGLFQISLNGRRLEKTFGAAGEGKWIWEDGGTVSLSHPQTEIALHDLTGFDGRCDAVLLLREEAASSERVPPSEPLALARLREELLPAHRRQPESRHYDFVVAGGGLAGCCAAIAAARCGLRVALVQDRPILGGNASSDVRVSPIGGVAGGPFPRIFDIIKSLRHHEQAKAYSEDLSVTDRLRQETIEAEPNIDLMLNTRLSDVLASNKRIQSVHAENVRTGRRSILTAGFFADCTGHAWLAHKAGARTMMGREASSQFNESLAPPDSDRLLLGNSQYWYAELEETDSDFPSCPWALPIESREDFSVSTPKYPQPDREGIAEVAGWNWESGFNNDPTRELEQVRDHNLRAVYGTWDFLKNKSPEKERYRQARLAWLAWVVGTRESRRVLGDLLLTQNDIVDRKPYFDGCVPTTWYFDLHYPHPLNSRKFPGQEFRSVAYDDPNWEAYGAAFGGQYTTIKPYPIPFRCLYSTDLDNLLLAGRNISVTHVALATVRVMNTCGGMGAVIGYAASLLKTLGISPRELCHNHWDGMAALLSDPPTRLDPDQRETARAT